MADILFYALAALGSVVIAYWMLSGIVRIVLLIVDEVRAERSDRRDT